MARWSRAFQSAYILLGYIMPLGGAVLGIAFVAMHGSKFGPKAVPVTKGDETVWVDGPPEFYLACFWLFTMLQILVVVSNVIGPCSCEHRLHFAFQIFGLACDLIYLVMANTSLQKWPNQAQVWNPRLFFNCSAVLMLFGQGVLALGAYYLSGICGKAQPESKEDIKMRISRLQHLNPVWPSHRGAEERGTARWEYEECDGDEGNSDNDLDDDDVEAMKDLYPHTINAYALQTSGRMDGCGDREKWMHGNGFKSVSEDSADEWLEAGPTGGGTGLHADLLGRKKPSASTPSH